MLNMHHHLATYGYTLCLIGTNLHEKTSYYPLKQTSMRTPDVHQNCIELVERRNFTAFTCVKGRSKLFDIKPNFPLAAPIDVMLQVYLGVVKVVLHVIVSKTVKSDIEYINNIVRSLKVSCISISNPDIQFQHALTCFCSFISVAQRIQTKSETAK